MHYKSGPFSFIPGYCIIASFIASSSTHHSFIILVECVMMQEPWEHMVEVDVLDVWWDYVMSWSRGPKHEWADNTCCILIYFDWSLKYNQICSARFNIFQHPSPLFNIIQQGGQTGLLRNLTELNVVEWKSWIRLPGASSSITCAFVCIIKSEWAGVMSHYIFCCASFSG